MSQGHRGVVIYSHSLGFLVRLTQILPSFQNKCNNIMPLYYRKLLYRQFLTEFYLQVNNSTKSSLPQAIQS